MDLKGQIQFLEPNEKAPPNHVALSEQELKLLDGTAEEHRLDKLISLRFNAWLEFNKLRPKTFEKIKMKAAYRAGFMASGQHYEN